MMQNPNPSRRSSRLAKAAAPIPATTVTPPPPSPQPQPQRQRQPPSSASSNNLNPNPKSKCKPKPPKKANNHPDYDPAVMAEKGKNHVWKEPSIQTYPPETLIKTSPHELCKLHKWLLNTQVDPVDDVYGDMPASILEGRRVNGEGKTHVVHTGRRKDRRVGESSAKWVQTETKKVHGLNGSVLGTHSSLVLYFMDDNKKTQAKWEMEEFISVDCVARNSAIVILKCTYGKWEKVEREVERAEGQLLRAYNIANTSTFDLQVALGLQIEELQKVRAYMRELDEQRSGVQAMAPLSHDVQVTAAREEEDPIQDIRLGKTLATATFRDPSETP